MKVLTASHCILEPLVAAHAREMFPVLGDPAIYEFENSPPINEEWLTERYKRLESRSSGDGAEQWLNWVIRLPSGKLAGYVQATVLPDHTAFVAYEINSRYWRQGIGSSAVAELLRALHEEYGVKMFVAVLKAKNYRSEGMLRKLGFIRAEKEDEARYRDEADEIVMVKTSSATASAA